MPYVDTNARRCRSRGKPPTTVGELTYHLQQDLLEFLRGKPELSYAAIAECLGALEGAKADLVDRVLLPYESKKRRENGDVWPELKTIGFAHGGPVSPLQPGELRRIADSSCRTSDPAFGGD